MYPEFSLNVDVIASFDMIEESREIKLAGRTVLTFSTQLTASKFCFIETQLLREGVVDYSCDI